MPLAPRVLAQQSPATQDDRLSWVGCQPVAPHTPSRKVLILRTPYTTRTGDMHDPATQLRRIPLPRTPVNNGRKKRGPGRRSPGPLCLSGSLYDSLGTPPHFKTRRHKLGVGTDERKHTAIRGDEHIVTRAIRKG